MIEALIDFVKKKKGTHLQSVKFLIFQTPMVSDFHQSMLKKQQERLDEEGGIMGWIKGMWMNTKYKNNLKNSTWKLYLYN